jgi:hypothetical protein
VGLALNPYWDWCTLAVCTPNRQGARLGRRGDWKERCGDNFYGQNAGGAWRQRRNRFHIGAEYLTKDTRRPTPGDARSTCRMQRRHGAVVRR